MGQRRRGRLLALADPRGLAPADAFSIALSSLSQHGALTGLTLATVEGLWRGFTTRAERQSIGSVAGVDHEVVLDFVQARNRDGSVPSTATMHLRRWSVRLLFQMLREIGVGVGDPTVDINLPPRAAGPIRPLTDAEIELCRLLAVHPPEATLKPAAWGLAEATAATSEIPAIRRRDVAGGAVRLPGSRLLQPRRADLGEWASLQIERRLHDLDGDPDALVAYLGDGKRPQAAAAMVIGKVLRRAGLAGEPGIKPASIRAWAGRRVFDETGSIEAVAQHLGLRSLDTAARLIGLDWRED